VPLLGLGIALMLYIKASFEMILSGELGVNQQFNLPWGAYSMLIIFGLITQVVMTGLVYEYMLLYKEKGHNNFTPADVAKALLRDIWGLTGFSILTFFMIALAAGILTGLTGVMAAINGFLAIPMVFILLFGMIYIMIPLTLLWVVKVFEQKGYGYTISRCFKLTKNQWWRTFGLIFVMSMIIGTMGAIFQIPFYIYFVFKIIVGAQSGEMAEFNQGLMLLLSLISVFGSTWLYSIFYLGIGFHYTSLKEEKDNDSILNRIEKISETSADEMV